MTTPDLRSIMPGRRARSRRTAASRLTSSILCQSSSVSTSNPPAFVSVPPTLFTKTSSPPHFCKNNSTAVELKMGRPRGFDEDAALEAAMQVFWEKSYEGATIADLTEAMGINRSSMYAAFGDKESVFRRVMERYRADRMTYIRQALAQPSLRQVVAGLIHGTAEFLSTPDNPRGCLLIQGALACGTDAEHVKLAMIDWRKSGEAALKKRL